MKKGRAGTMTHDYKRHGVTTLFAALNVLEGKVIGQCMKRHRHQEFIRYADPGTCARPCPNRAALPCGPASIPGRSKEGTGILVVSPFMPRRA